MTRRPVVEGRPLRVRVAMRAMQDLFADPEETSHVFRIIRALSPSRRFEKLFYKTMASEEGRRVLEERESLLNTLNDRERLRALPDGTLGREYARFMDAEQISGDGLESASNPYENVFYDERARRFSDRLRDAHDLWHVLTGYGRDFVGEDALLAFSYAQTRNWGVGFIALMGYLRFRREGMKDALPVVRDGYRRGRKAAFLPAVEWEVLLERPLDEVRRLLGIDDPRAYRPIAQDSFEANGLEGARAS